VAEALLPPGGPLPGAEGDGGVPVAAPVSDLVAAMSPRTRTLVRTGLRACEWSTFPRRFSRLSRERRAAVAQAIVAAANDSNPANCVGLVTNRSSMIQAVICFEVFNASLATT